jgi:hypothetical protein
VTWTKEVPKVDGWYWTMNYSFGKWHGPWAGKKDGAWWTIAGAEEAITEDELVDTKFYGPIEVPPLPLPQQPPR